MIHKYPSLKQELNDLHIHITRNPKSGIYLGFDTYKIRISIKSKGKGKRGGGRIITYVITNKKEVYLLLIYDKSEFDTIDNKRIKSIIESLSKRK